MSDLDALSMTESRTRPAKRHRPGWWIVVCAPLVGAALGVVARCWMRLITEDPEFSWSGTIFIVLAFTIAGAGQGVAWAVRRAGVGRRWSTTARVAAGILTLPIFTGAGAMMLPTVFGASLAGARNDWPRAARLAAALVAIPVPIIIAADLVDNGITPGVLLGVVLMVVTYAVVVRSSYAITAPIADGWRTPRTLRVLTVVAGAIALLFVAFSAVGLG